MTPKQIRARGARLLVFATVLILTPVALGILMNNEISGSLNPLLVVGGIFGSIAAGFGLVSLIWAEYFSS